MKLIKFLFSKVFFINLIIALIFLIVGLFILDNYLDKLTKHGEKIVVPSLKNKKVTEKVKNSLSEINQIGSWVSKRKQHSSIFILEGYGKEKNQKEL